MSLVQRPPPPPSAKPPAGPIVVQSKDWHATLATLLLKAEKATDSLERMLAVCRAVLAFLTFPLRPGTRYADTPCALLGQHYLSHRELGEQHRGDVTRAYLQETCAYDTADGPTPHAKYEANGHTDVALWQLSLTPVSRPKLRKESTLLVGSTGPAYLEIELVGGGSVQFPRHAERYEFLLPALVLADPQAEPCPLEWEGSCSVGCDATGLRCEIGFKAWKDRAVKGEVTRLQGDGQQRIARIEGCWDGQLTAVGLEVQASGTMFDAADYSPPLPSPPSLSLSHPGPQTLPRLWVALLEAALYTHPGAGGGAGRRGEALVAALPGLMEGALLFEVPEGPKSAKSAQLEGAAAAAAAADPRPLPPAVRAQHAQGRSLRYQLQYLVQAVSQAALEVEAEGGAL